jgi:hypothetical protein
MSVIQSDVTLDAKRVLGVARALCSRKVKVTAAQLAQAVRGTGEKAKALQLAPEDQVTLSFLVRPVSFALLLGVELMGVGMQDTETVIAYMLIEGFLGETYTSNAYGTQVYLTPGRFSQRLDEGQKLIVDFLLPERAARDHGKRKAGRRRRVSNVGMSAHSPEDEDADADFGDYSGEEDEVEEIVLGSPTKRRRSNYRSSWITAALDDTGIDSGSDPEDGEWKGNLRGAPAAIHRTLRSGPRRLSGPAVSGTNSLREIEVIEISSD